MKAALDLSFSEDQEAICAALSRFCAQQNVEDTARQSGADFPRALWRQLAELGVFEPAASTSAQAGGALEICAIAETLGTHVFPGPLAATYLAVAVTDPADTAALITGHTLVSLSHAGSTLLPWGTAADVFLVVDNTEVALAAAPAQVAPVETLGGEIWGRAELRIEKTLQGATRGLILANIANAAYLGGIAWRLLTQTSDYVGTRRQFGQTLGEFQAVSHPLANCAIAITAAQTLARAAACAFDNSADKDTAALARPQTLAAGALLSASRAALKTSFSCHQAYGGIGITLAGPAFYMSRRIRQVASQASAAVRERDLLLAEADLGG